MPIDSHLDVLKIDLDFSILGWVEQLCLTYARNSSAVTVIPPEASKKKRLMNVNGTYNLKLLPY